MKVLEPLEPKEAAAEQMDCSEACCVTKTFPCE
jgi:hypothetical protein